MSPRFLVLGLLLLGSPLRAATADLSIGYLPPVWVTERVRQVLSPEGRFVIFQQTGKVRVIDSDAKIAEATQALANLQHAPATVAVQIEFTAFGKKTVEKIVPAAPDGFPYPRRFEPPKLIPNGGGGYTVVPSQPRDFQGPAAPPRTVTTTEQTKQIVRRVAASLVTPQSSTIPILTAVADPAGLRAFAAKLKALDADEPAWTAAGTELRLRPELVNGELQITVIPVVVLPPAKAGQEPRRLPLSACSVVVPLTRADPNPLGTLPRADAEFYRHFLGAPNLKADEVVALRFAGQVRYVGSLPAR